MNCFENEYALSIILGGGDNSIEIADLLRRKINCEIHIFSQKLSMLGRLKYKFHKLPSYRDEICLFALSDFARGLHEYYTPILIYTDNHQSDFINKHLSKLEDLFIIISSDDVQKILNEGKSNEDQ